MSPFEKFALDHFLTDYPKDKTFMEVLDLIESEIEVEPEDRTIEIWHPFERKPLEDVIDYINEMEAALEASFSPKESVNE